MVNITGHHGVVRGLDYKQNFTVSLPLVCDFHIHSPEGTFLLLELRHNMRKCRSSYSEGVKVFFFNTKEKYDIAEYDRGIGNIFTAGCKQESPWYFNTSHNNLYLRYTILQVRDKVFEKEFLDGLQFSIRYQAQDRQQWSDLPAAVPLTRCSGYMTSLGYDDGFRFPEPTDAWAVMTVPVGHSIMVSFPRFDLPRPNSFFEMFIDNDTSPVLKEKGRKAVSTRVYSDLKQLTFHLQSHRVSYDRLDSYVLGFKLLYSFHYGPFTPQKVGVKMFNCSVDHYPNFKQHLDCNLDVECHDKRDETGDCPFSSRACQGNVASGNKCLIVISTDFQDDTEYNSNSGSWNKADFECQAHGGQLITVKTNDDLKNIFKLWTSGKYYPSSSNIGLIYREKAAPRMYKHLLMWVDKTVVYFYDSSLLGFSLSTSQIDRKYCGLMKPTDYAKTTGDFAEANGIPLQINIGDCWRAKSADLHVCEMNLPSTSSTKSILLSASSQSWKKHNLSLTFCPKGHVTHQFLMCDVKANCGEERFVSQCPFASAMLNTTGGSISLGKESSSVSMFACGDGKTIHYALVCNFIKDCPRGSDESFCSYPCDGSQCQNGQCVHKTQHCGQISNCMEEPDDQGCVEHFGLVLTTGVRPPAVITLDGKGSFTLEKLDENATCPETHFRCLGEFDYCMPVYTRCNGYKDCLGGEDEEGCEDAPCPGLYRCRDSQICVHAEHVCDSWAQCLQHDDEWLCNVKPCPNGCLCQGLAFLCHRPFREKDFPDLKYLDIRNTPINLYALHSFAYLVYLKLENCSIQSLEELNFTNLHMLDLSSNDIKMFGIKTLSNALNLKTLVLSGNPLKLFISEDAHRVPQGLEVLDLSYTKLEMFDSEALSFFQKLQNLDLSHSSICSLGRAGGFQHFPQLQRLDISKNPIMEYYPALTEGLSNIRVIVATSYRLCCLNNPPAMTRCLSDEAKLSSCKSLLQHKSYQVTFIGFSGISLLGNLACILIRHVKFKEPSRNFSFSVLMTSLNIAHLLMPFYLGILSAADEYFRGAYIHHELMWINSTLCKVAMFLSVLSKVVSALMVLLITLNKFFDLRRNSWRFTDKAVIVLTSCAWCVGVTMAGVPLLSQGASFRNYGLSGLCVPLPLHSQSNTELDIFLAHSVLYLTLSVLVSVMIVLLFHFTKTHRQELFSDSYENRLTRQIRSVVITNCLCWAGIGFVGVHTFVKNYVVDEMISVVTGIFMLPINSALDPILYILNQTVENNREKTKQKLLAILTHRAELMRKYQKR